jgi:hypothetical protein
MAIDKGAVLLTIKTFEGMICKQIKNIKTHERGGSDWKQERWVIFSPVHGKSCLIQVDPDKVSYPLGRSGYIFVKDFFPKYTIYKGGVVYVGMHKYRTGVGCSIEALPSEDEVDVVRHGDLNISDELPVWRIAFVQRKEDENISALVG